MSFYLYFVHMRRQLKPVSRKKTTHAFSISSPPGNFSYLSASHRWGVWGVHHCASSQVRVDLFLPPSKGPTFAPPLP